MKKVLLALAAAGIAAVVAYWFSAGHLAEDAETSVSLNTETSTSAAETAYTNATTSTSASLSTVTSPVPVTGAPASRPEVTNPAAFAKKLESTQAALPTLDQLKKLKTEEVHETPKPVLQAGQDIGDVAESIEKNPQLAPQGLEFYGKCARRNDLSTSVRALCLSDLRDLAKKLGTAADEKGISEPVVKLANKLQDDTK